ARMGGVSVAFRHQSIDTSAFAFAGPGPIYFCEIEKSVIGAHRPVNARSGGYLYCRSDDGSHGLGVVRAWRAIARFIGRAGCALDCIEPLRGSTEVRIGLEIFARSEAVCAADRLRDQLAEFRNIEIRGVHELFPSEI